jgi:NhaA family Na+:H+ antiporter
VNWRLVTAVGMLAGIGFTVSIFISSLAFDSPVLLTDAKAAVLGASVLAGVVGYFSLRRAVSTEPQPVVSEAAAD